MRALSTCGRPASLATPAGLPLLDDTSLAEEAWCMHAPVSDADRASDSLPIFVSFVANCGADLQAISRFGEIVNINRRLAFHCFQDYHCKLE